MIWNKNDLFSFISIKCQIIFCTDCVCFKLVEGSSYMGKECIGRPPLWHRNLAACWPWLEWIQLQRLGIQKCCLHRQVEFLFSIWICQDNSFLPLLVLEYVHGWTAGGPRCLIASKLAADAGPTPLRFRSGGEGYCLNWDSACQSQV